MYCDIVTADLAEALGEGGASVCEECHEDSVTRMPGSGIHTVTVPGAVAGWDAMRARFGKLPMADLLAPAIYYADEGFPVTDVIANFWANGAARLAAEPLAAQTFLPNGRAPSAGEVFRNPRLAGTLRLIAQKGAAGFRAEAIVQASV